MKKTGLTVSFQRGKRKPNMGFYHTKCRSGQTVARTLPKAVSSFRTSGRGWRVEFSTPPPSSTRLPQARRRLRRDPWPLTALSSSWDVLSPWRTIANHQEECQRHQERLELRRGTHDDARQHSSFDGSPCTLHAHPGAAVTTPIARFKCSSPGVLYFLFNPVTVSQFGFFALFSRYFYGMNKYR